MVTGSPLHIIPASPPRADEDSRDEEDTTGDEEDIDEDILYLRLIALRSMAAEDKLEEGNSTESRERQEVLAREMQELIEEAEEAASYEMYQNAG
jgi:hypothetical protein